MNRGLAPIDPETGASMELHHIWGRQYIPDPDSYENLMPVWPWEHDYIDPYRHYNGPTPSSWTGEFHL